MLSTRMTDDVLVALSRLKASPDFQHFLDFVQQELDQADQDNRLKDGTELARSQGKSLILAAILEATQDAAKNLMSRRASRPQ